MAVAKSCVPDSGCTFARVFLTYSALYAVGFGLLVLLAPVQAVQMIRLTMFESFETAPEVMQLMGCLMLGWGAGKFATVFCGSDGAITFFCTLNLVPMTVGVVSTLPPVGKPQLMSAIMLCYLLCAATGLRQEREKSSWTAATLFLFVSACVITAEGICMLVAPELPLNAVGIDKVDRTQTMLLGACCLGWAAGKWACIYNGDLAMHLFCKFNLLPMIAGIITSAAQHDRSSLGTYLCFSLGYLFLALSGPPEVDDDDDVESQLPRMLTNKGRYGHMNSKTPDTSKLPYVPQRRPSFEFMNSAMAGRADSKEAAFTTSTSLKEPLIDAALPEPLRQVSTGSSSGKFASINRIPSKEGAAMSKQAPAPKQPPAFQFLKA